MGSLRALAGFTSTHAAAPAQTQSMLDVLRNHVTGKAHIKANLKHYRYFDNVSGTQPKSTNVTVGAAQNSNLQTNNVTPCVFQALSCMSSLNVHTPALTLLRVPSPVMRAPCARACVRRACV